ncbi:MAG: hypothetical protein QM791_11190 [Ferruginibacter sp.]
MYKAGFILLTVITVFITGCKKDEPRPPGDPNDNKLLRSIEWSNGVKASMQYNGNYNLSKIIYTHGNITGATVINWQGSKVKEMFDDRSLFKNSYYYSRDRITHYINSFKAGTSSNSFKMEYTYNADGYVAVLKYFSTTEAGTTLKTTTNYEYNAAGDLVKATTLTPDITIIHTIVGYSEPADFDPLIFVETGLFENYTIFNLPVMSQLKKYPVKITRAVKAGNDPLFIDKIDENTCEITGKRINKMNTKIIFPATPDYNLSITGTFKYE